MRSLTIIKYRILKIEETETLFRGERLNDEEFDELVSGFEDNQGNVDYGKFIRMVMEETLESS